MPGLVAFKRRWSIGSDDLVLPAFALALLNILWVFTLSVLLLHIFTTHRYDHPCSEGFIWYPAGTIGLQLMLLASHVSLAVHSGRGSVFDTKARKHLPLCCYIRTALKVLEVIWFCSGCVLLNHRLLSQECNSSSFIYVLMCVVVGTNMVVMSLSMLAIFLSFDSAGKTFHRLQRLRNSIDNNETDQVSRATVSHHEIELLSGKLKNKYEEKWMSRVNKGFCCTSISKPTDKNVFKEIALLCASYLDQLDLVLSDFIAGMMLLRQQQKVLFADTVQQPTNDIYQYLSGAAISPRTKFLTLKDEDTQSEFECMVYFAEYAVASYGWQGQCFFYPTKACCQLNVCCRCKGCARWERDLEFTGDNCCQCQYAAISTGSPLLSQHDFIYGNYENETNMPSYYVCIDHKYKKVLLCIRGTMSMSDAIIDLQGDSKEIKVHPRQSTWLGHSGMVSAASNVYAELMENKVFEDAFSRCQGQDFRLLIIGHSLGAGVASIIAFMLKEQYPQLYCYAYAPPGGLLSPEAMEESKRFTTSVVVGKDMIPRMGTAQLEYFRSDVLSLLEESTVPKWKILSSGLPLIGRCLKLQNGAQLPKARSQDYNPFQPKVLSSTHSPLYPPGRVIHVVKNYPKEGGKKEKPLYQAIWADNKSFDTIIVSPSMIDDHMPDTVLDAMQQVLAHHGPKKPTKVLTEEQRQAILNVEDSESCHDRQSRTSGLSWEYTCQSEANAVLQKSVETNGKVVPYTSPNGGLDTPTQWQPAPLASQEDLLSIRRSTPSISSNKGLSESMDSFFLSRPTKSTSDVQPIDVTPSLAAISGSGNTDLPQSQSSTCEASTSSCVEEVTSQEQITADTSTPNSLSIPTEQSYFAHIGHGNQMEYNNADPSNASGCFYNALPTSASSEKLEKTRMSIHLQLPSTC